ncbi:MAG TPA: hypothetical protein VL634_25840 [Mycobacterium sp.]|nr:hypothetical protein [Mycobacterium sp.]
MKKFALSLGTAGTLAVMALGLAGPALATPSDVNYQAVDCHVHVIYQGNPVDVTWC